MDASAFDNIFARKAAAPKPAARTPVRAGNLGLTVIQKGSIESLSDEKLAAFYVGRQSKSKFQIEVDELLFDVSSLICFAERAQG